MWTEKWEEKYKVENMDKKSFKRGVCSVSIQIISVCSIVLLLLFLLLVRESDTC